MYLKLSPQDIFIDITQCKRNTFLWQRHIFLAKTRLLLFCKINIHTIFNYKKYLYMQPFVLERIISLKGHDNFKFILLLVV